MKNRITLCIFGTMLINSSAVSQVLQSFYAVPESKKIRVIITSDAADEVDDQFAILHALLTPQFIVKGIVAAHFGKGRKDSQKKSYAEANKIVSFIPDMHIPVVNGSLLPLSDSITASPSAGSKLIVREAMAADSLPLYIINFGPLTDLASALMTRPEIAKKITAIWSGGGPYPGGGNEFNMDNDIIAANVVLASSMEFWQVPSNVYSQVRIGTAELCIKLRHCGAAGEYLFKGMMAFNKLNESRKGWPRGEDWTLGDSPAISLLMDTQGHADFFEMVNAPQIAVDKKYIQQKGTRKIRVYNHIDSRFLLEDMFAKFMLQFGNN